MNQTRHVLAGICLCVAAAACIPVWDILFSSLRKWSCRIYDAVPPYSCLVKRMPPDIDWIVVPIMLIVVVAGVGVAVLIMEER